MGQRGREVAGGEGRLGEAGLQLTAPFLRLLLPWSCLCLTIDALTWRKPKYLHGYNEFKSKDIDVSVPLMGINSR